MKRISRILLLILSLFIFTNLNVSGQSEFVETGNAGYRVVERKETNDLKFGVSHYFDKSETKRGGALFSQEVSILEIPATSEAKIISYSNLANIVGH